MRPATWSTRSPKPRSKAAGPVAVRLGAGATNLLQQLSCAHGRAAGADATKRPSRQCIGRRELFLFAGIQGRLPCRGLLAWRGGNCLDLLFFGLLGLPI